MTRLVAFVFGMFVVMSGLASASPFETPEALLEAFYEPYFTGEFLDDERIFWSAELSELYRIDGETTPEGEMGALSFDPYVDGQDFELTDFAIGDPQIDGEQALVDVRFNNFDRPTELTYELVWQGGGWRINDVVSRHSEYPYRLSEIFASAAE